MASFGSVELVDASDVTLWARRMRMLASQFGPLALKNKPEFGAYMDYSLFLEKGTKNPDGSVRMKARPHIEISVEQNAQFIVKHVGNALMTINAKVFTSKGTYGPTQQAKEYRDAWLSALMANPRLTAVAFAKSIPAWEFGFHARSIRGYATARSDASIVAQQKAANRKRKVMEKAKRGKK